MKKRGILVTICLLACIMLPFSFHTAAASEHEYDWDQVQIPYYQRAAYQYFIDTIGQNIWTRYTTSQELSNINFNLDLGELYDGITIDIPAVSIIGNINDPSVQSNTYACYITQSGSYSGSYSGSSTAGSESGQLFGSSAAHCVFRTGAVQATINSPDGSETITGSLSGTQSSTLYSYLRTVFDDGSLTGNYTPPSAATLQNTLVGAQGVTYTFAFMSNVSLTASRDVLMYGSANKSDIVITGVRNRQEYGMYFTVIEYSMASGATGNPRFVPVFNATSSLDVIPIYLGDKSKMPADMYRTVYNDQYLAAFSSLQEVLNSFKTQQHDDMTTANGHLSSINQNIATYGSRIDVSINNFATQQHNDMTALASNLELTSQSSATQQANQALASAGSGLETQADTFTSTVGDIESLESVYSDMFDDNIQMIVTDESALNSRPEYIRAARWVKAQFNFLTSNNAFGDLIVFALTCGVTILILGRESDE